MPLRRRMYRKRPRISRAKMARRRVGVRRPRQPVHLFKRTFRVGDLIASYNAATGITSPIQNAVSFNLSQLPNSGEFTSLYDQYCIKGIRVNIQPLLTEGISSAVSGSTNVWGFPKFNSVIDYDDVSVPATEDVLLQYNTLKQTPVFREHKRYFKPKVRTAALDAGAVVAANGVRANQWISSSNPTVPHFGIKVFMPGPIASGSPVVSSSIAYSMYATMYIACRNTK